MRSRIKDRSTHVLLLLVQLKDVYSIPNIRPNPCWIYIHTYIYVLIPLYFSRREVVGIGRICGLYTRTGALLLLNFVRGRGPSKWQTKAGR